MGEGTEPYDPVHILAYSHLTPKGEGQNPASPPLPPSPRKDLIWDRGLHNREYVSMRLLSCSPSIRCSGLADTGVPHFEGQCCRFYAIHPERCPPSCACVRVHDQPPWRNLRAEKGREGQGQHTQCLTENS